MTDRPNHAEESALYREGYRRIAGFDEAGRGALAGPVVAAVVILPEKPDFDWVPLVVYGRMSQMALTPFIPGSGQPIR